MKSSQVASRGRYGGYNDKEGKQGGGKHQGTYQVMCIVQLGAEGAGGTIVGSLLYVSNTGIYQKLYNKNQGMYRINEFYKNGTFWYQGYQVKKA